MSKLNPAIQAVKQASGAYIVTYTIVDTNGVKYSQKCVELTQSEDQCLPGVEAQVILTPQDGSGSTFEGEFEISTNYQFNEEKNFLQVTIFSEAVSGGKLKREGGTIIRHKDAQN